LKVEENEEAGPFLTLPYDGLDVLKIA